MQIRRAVLLVAVVSSFYASVAQADDWEAPMSALIGWLGIF